MSHETDRPAVEDFAVVVAALLAGRTDGQQAVASITAIHEKRLAAHDRQVAATAWDEGTQAMADELNDGWYPLNPERVPRNPYRDRADRLEASDD